MHITNSNDVPFLRICFAIRIFCDFCLRTYVVCQPCLILYSNLSKFPLIWPFRLKMINAVSVQYFQNEKLNKKLVD